MTLPLKEISKSSFKSKCIAFTPIISAKTPFTSDVNYYDLPINDNAPDFERTIYKYLQSHNVRMSGPSMISDNPYTRNASKSPRPHLKTPSMLQARRKGKFGGIFLNLQLDTDTSKNPS